MKSTTYARLTLFLPYLSLIESIGYFRYYDLDEKESFLQTFNFFWNFFAVFWFVPYTILVIYLLIWSIRKTTEQIKSAYISAPVIMMFLSVGIFTLIFFVGLVSNNNFIEGAGIILIFAAMISVPASFILGYIFVGGSLLIYKLLQKANLIQD